MNIKAAIISEVLKKHPDAKPCGNRKSLVDSFTHNKEDGWILWFLCDVPGSKGTTHIMRECDLIKRTKK